MEPVITALANQSDAFRRVLELVEIVVRKIKGLGPLAAYDATELLGYRFEFEPQMVYLHAGTRVGAVKLLGAAAIGANESLPLAAFVDFPVADLSAPELEDFLCIYADELPG